jgi:hypothetical protein
LLVLAFGLLWVIAERQWSLALCGGALALQAACSPTMHELCCIAYACHLWLITDYAEVLLYYGPYLAVLCVANMLPWAAMMLGFEHCANLLVCMSSAYSFVFEHLATLPAGPC